MLKSKQDIINNYNEPENVHAIFNLAWSYFLTYDELKEVNHLEAYDTAYANKEVHSPKEWNERVVQYTKENILKVLEKVIIRSFNQALEGKAIASSLNFDEVKTWGYILGEKKIINHHCYGWFGLPLYKLVAKLYHFHNPIGKDNGNELRYRKLYNKVNKISNDTIYPNY